MSYGFQKYVCIDHQRSAKMFRRSARPRCPDCQLEMLMVGPTTHIPRRGDDAAWTALWSRARSANQSHEQWAANYRKESDAYWGKRLLRKIMARFA